MKSLLLTVMLLTFAVLLPAQITAVSIEKLPVSLEGLCNSPRFSPDGLKIYFTDAGYNGIWEFTIPSGEVRQITDAKASGFNFSISADGDEIAYRTTTLLDEGRNRRQEIVRQNLRTGDKNIIAAGEDAMTPVYHEDVLVYNVDGKTFIPAEAMGGVTVLGIDLTKIFLARGNEKVMFDPLENGSYIWPRLSPDRTLIVASDMRRGAFVADLDGKVLSMLGKRNAPCWTRDGEWIIYMHDKDDGHNILSSDIMAVTPDGGNTVQLTFTDDVVEMYPDCSPVDNLIVCSSLEGDLYLIRYGE